MRIFMNRGQRTFFASCASTTGFFLLTVLFAIFPSSFIKAQIHYNFAWHEEDLKELIPYRDTVTVLVFGKYQYGHWKTEDEEIPFPDSVLLFHNLEALRIGWQTDITRLDPHIGKLKKLRKLEITLYNMGPEIRHLTALEHLVVSGMRSDFPKEFAELKNLNYLYLHNDSVSRFPVQLYELHNLKELQVFFNRIEIFPDGIARLSKLEKLRIGSRIKSLPRDLIALKHLEEMHLNFSGKAALDTEIPWLASVSSLRKLDINYPGIEQFPKQIDLLDQVKSLKIRTTNADFDSVNNHLRYLAGMDSLQTLDLYLGFRRSDKTGKLPDALRDLKNLRTLELEYYDLKEIPEWLGQLKKLEKINFKGLWKAEQRAMILKNVPSNIQVLFEGKPDKAPVAFKQVYEPFLATLKTGDTLTISYLDKRNTIAMPIVYELNIVKTLQGYEAVDELIEGFDFKPMGWKKYKLEEKDLNILKELDEVTIHLSDPQGPLLEFYTNGIEKTVGSKNIEKFVELYNDIKKPQKPSKIK